MNLTNKYKLNNVDMYTAYGFFGKDGLQILCSLPENANPFIQIIGLKGTAQNGIWTLR